MNASITYGIMKRTVGTITGALLLLSTHVHATGPDEWRGRSGNILLQNWSLALTLGFTSYYGDLSQYDANYFNKLIFESKPAIGVKLTKYFHPLIGISGQVIYGGFRSDFLPDHTFDLRLLEYNVQAVFDAAPLVFPGRSIPYGIEVSAGMGQFLFQTTVNASTGEQPAAPIMDGTPEFVYFFGGTFYYKVNRNFRATIDLSIRQAQNDNIDKYIASKDFDYYSWLAVGITWSINSTFSVKKYRAMNRVNNRSPRWRR